MAVCTSSAVTEPDGTLAIRFADGGTVLIGNALIGMRYLGNAPGGIMPGNGNAWLRLRRQILTW